MPIQIDQQKKLGCLVLALRGSFETVDEAKRVRVAVADALAQGQAFILVNLAAVEVLGTIGLETLLASAFMVQHAGGLFRVLPGSEANGGQLEKFGADGLVTSVADEDAAVEELRSQAETEGKHFNEKPFDILEFVRDEERRGETMADLSNPEPLGSET